MEHVNNNQYSRQHRRRIYVCIKQLRGPAPVALRLRRARILKGLQLIHHHFNNVVEHAADIELRLTSHQHQLARSIC